jgi:hypothetical protein
MPESGTYGSVRGVPSNGHPYRDRCAGAHRRPWWTTLASCPPRPPSPTISQHSTTTTFIEPKIKGVDAGRGRAVSKARSAGISARKRSSLRAQRTGNHSHGPAANPRQSLLQSADS